MKRTMAENAESFAPSFEVDAPGGLGAALASLGFRGVLVVTHDDGRPVGDHDRALVAAMVEAAARELADVGPMRDAAATVHLRAARDRARAAAAASTTATTAGADGERAA